MTGAERADAGALRIAGENVALDRMTPAAARGRGIAAVYQHPALFPDLTIAENIAIAVEAPRPWHPIDWRGRRARRGLPGANRGRTRPGPRGSFPQPV